VASISAIHSANLHICRILFGERRLVKTIAAGAAGRHNHRREKVSEIMRLLGRGSSLLAALVCWSWLGQSVAADDIQTPWEPLPADARLVSDPADLTALLANHTVRGVYLPDGSRWREYSAADGRTVWEVEGCLHPGTWKVSGSAVCYVYPTWDDGRPQCFMVYQSTRLTHFVWLDPATGDQWLISNALSLDQGNPDQLPLEGAPICGDPAV
jgi:hypothetical protein